MFKVLEKTFGNLIAIEIDGHIEKKDYDKVTPLIEKVVREYGKVKLYIQINSIKGIEPAAFMKDVKTYLNHFNDVDKIAVVGENKWQKFWSDLADPFVSGEIRFFTHSEIAEAQTWIET